MSIINNQNYNDSHQNCAPLYNENYTYLNNSAKNNKI